MNKFTYIQEHFRKLRCSHCQASFTPEGVKLLREEQDYMVVRVHCTACKEPSGVAVVGLDFDGPQESAPRVERSEKAAGPRGIFSNRKEEERFAQMKPISSDDVLNASEFIRALGDDWMRHLNR